MTGFQIPIGQGARPSFIAGQFANRHGLIAGATGSGKSVTLLTLAEGFSRAGVPVFLADVKGDLARIAASCPTQRLDVYGRTGARLSIRLDSLGADMVARMLDLTDAQAGSLDVAFELARSERRPLATLADLRRLLGYMIAHHRQLGATYGHLTPASVSVIQRSLIRLERDGSAALFGPSTFDVGRLLDQPGGRGLVMLLDATRLSQTQGYAAALLFMLTDLFARLPEVGDLPAPRLALFLDEAHLLFAEMPPRQLQRIERTIRLIRSKGVGVYFASQSPADIPPNVLGQLQNRIQHGLRGATLVDLRAIRAAAETMPLNPKLDAAAEITRLGVGRALVSTVGADGVPQPCDLVRVRAPDCLAAPLPVYEPTDEAPAPITRELTRGQRFKGLALAMASSVAVFGSIGLAVFKILGG
jgi:hypothetical protein